MIDIARGLFTLDDMTITSNFTFQQFQKSKHYKNQSPIRVIWLKNQFHIDGHRFIASLFFRNEKIYMLSMLCVDEEYTLENEIKRKELHDQILKDWDVEGTGYYLWGSITSAYDSRSNISSIDVQFR